MNVLLLRPFSIPRSQGALGLIKDEAKFNQYWKSMEHKLPGRKRTPLLPRNPQVVPISCVGVWDTVGAVRSLVIRETLNLLSLPDHELVTLRSQSAFFDASYSLPDIVQSALHVVAYHENRKLFDVVLFNDEHKKRNQICEQMLFAGCHSDVGGGGIPPHGGKNILPDVTLDWIVRNMPSTLRVALGEKLETEVPPWYPLQSAFHDGPFWKRIPDKLFRRQYLTTTPDLQKHSTLLGLPSPGSSYLLEHDWELMEIPDGVAENGMPLMS
ncbi:hypothetical protein FRC12_020289 [Ceratobasidium sp. 428]|nr:hypothetical protein FRC12_020289 [Ceratobasidium sp. 428]